MQQPMTTAQAVVSMLEVNGIDTIFCLPGVQNDAFFDALYDRTNGETAERYTTRTVRTQEAAALADAAAIAEAGGYYVVPAGASEGAAASRTLRPDQRQALMSSLGASELCTPCRGSTNPPPNQTSTVTNWSSLSERPSIVSAV